MAKSSKDHPTQPEAPRQGEVGRLLRSTREKQGIDLRAASDALRIRHAHLLSIEEGRYGDLPGATYAVGFVRAYAEQLGLDGAEIVRRFKQESAIQTQNELAFPTPVNEGGVPSGAIIVMALVLAGGVYGAWHFMASSDRSVVEMIQDVPDRLSAMLSRDDAGDEPEVVLSEPLEEALIAPMGGSADDGLPVGERRFLDDDAVPDGDSVDPAPAVVREQVVAQEAAGEATVADAPPAAEPAAPPTPETEPSPEPPPVVPDPQVVTLAPTPEGAPEQVAPEPGADVTVERRTAVIAEAAPAARDPAPEPEPVAPSEPEPARVDAAAPPAAPPAPSSGRADDRGAAPSAPMLEAVSLPPVGRVYGEEHADSRVVLRARSDSWIQVRDGQNLLMTRLLRPGDAYRLPNRQGLTLMTGNAGGLLIEVDGQLLPPLGRTGEVRRDIPLDVEQLHSGAAASN